MKIPCITFANMIVLIIIFILLLGIVVWNNPTAWESAGGFFGAVGVSIQYSWMFVVILSVWWLSGFMIGKDNCITLAQYLKAAKNVTGESEMMEGSMAPEYSMSEENYW